MKFEYNIQDSAGSVTIDINGTIGDYSTDEHSVSSYNDFTRKIREIGASSARKVIVNIRSTGGNVNDALLIYEQLKALSAKVVTRCYGYTASAATIIAQAASKGERKMSANSLYLIHQSMTYADGNSNDFETSLDLLKKTDERIVAIYADASGRPAEEFEALMRENNGRGRWLSADEALEYGLIDEIISAEPIKNINKEDIIGLPEPPQIKDNMEDKKGILDRISAWFEKRVDGEVAELTANLADERAKVDNLVTERDTLKVENEEQKATIANLTEKVSNLEEEIAHLKAMAVEPTEPTQQVQDQEPTPAQPTKTANEQAYDDDVKAFK
jgi:ATP-dependent Clp endopeptidase proteolytic subunit ClpP